MYAQCYEDSQGSNRRPFASQVYSLCLQTLHNPKAEESAKMWDKGKCLSIFFPFVLPAPFLPLRNWISQNPMYGFDESVKFSALLTPIQVCSFNLGLTNHSTSPPWPDGAVWRTCAQSRSARILSWEPDTLQRGERSLSFSKLIKLG